MRSDKQFDDYKPRRPIKAKRHPHRLPIAEIDAQVIKIMYRIRLPADYMD